MKPWHWISIGLLIGLLTAGLILLLITPNRGEPIILESLPTASPITVFVTGAVVSPGVYTLPVDSRARDAIDAAGGFTYSADSSAVNLAARLRDGEKLMVPVITTPEPGKVSEIPTLSIPTPSPDKPININTATAEELDLLPGIGPSKAAAIITYRNKNGDFKRLEDLMNVPGIGPSIFAQIQDLITLEPIP